MNRRARAAAAVSTPASTPASIPASILASILAGSLAAALLVLFACSRGEPKDSAVEAARMAELRRVHEALHDSLEGLVTGDTLLAEAAADTGQVVVAIRATLVESLIHEVTRRYLDRVELALQPEVKVKEGGSIRTKVLFAKVKAGDWNVYLTIHRINGVLRAKTPQVSVTGTNRIHLVIPVVLEEGRGEATIRFTWDASSVASVICRDFETVQRITGSVLPQEYEIDGDFVLSASAETVVAQPEFPEEKFRLRVDLSPQSWAEVRRKLEAQDKIFRCGIALNPADVVEKLHALGRKGFNIKLPRSIFQMVELPASVSESVRVEDREVRLSVKPNVLRVTPQSFWYSAAVSTEIVDVTPDSLPADTLLPPDPLSRPGAARP